MGGALNPGRSKSAAVVVCVAGALAVVFAIRDLLRRRADATQHDREQAMVVEKRIEDGKHQVRFGWIDRHAQPHSAWITVSDGDYDADELGHTQDVYVSKRDPDVAWLETEGEGPTTAGDWVAIFFGSLLALAGGAGATVALLKSTR